MDNGQPLGRNFTAELEVCIDDERQFETAVPQKQFCGIWYYKNEVIFVWPGAARAPSFLATSLSFWSD